MKGEKEEVLKKRIMGITGALLISLAASVVFSGYHHMGEKDVAQFLKAYPDKEKTKLDSCALCHTGGQYEKRPGVAVSLGSCQWCHYKYGYDGSGNIIDTLNSYGRDYLANGRNAVSVCAIDSKDSDGDGHTNEAEIKAVSFPGNKGDDPGKQVAPFRIYTRQQLDELPQHTQFLLMNSSKSGDFYAEYEGVALETLLRDAGLTDNASGIRVYSPDGWSQYHPLEADPDPALYHVFGTYPSATYQYDVQADKTFGGWCDYGSPLCSVCNHEDPINVQGGLKLILASKRGGEDLMPGLLTTDNKLDGEGPYRVIVPQKGSSPPDQASNASNQNVIWPYRNDWDHNSGSSTRSATIIKVEPLPEGTTDIDLLEAGWQFVEEGKIIIYGAISQLHGL
ncbi:hypothetical protein OAC89_01285 [Deltaproteobacteria bacterium]|nr:hypothetical protein [Deltaproteobacteria bacterium]